MGFFGSSSSPKKSNEGKSGGGSSSTLDKKKKSKKQAPKSSSPLRRVAEKASPSVMESNDADASRRETDIAKSGAAKDKLREQVGEEHEQRPRQRSGSASSSSSSIKLRHGKGKGKEREETTRSLHTSHVPGPGGSSFNPEARAAFFAEQARKRTKPIDEGQTGP
ncbi:hypothetical protein IFR05_008141 [Cadophora sp. M221]|nr:hypothetical protein IFR05_008141 [Cadophora sp. M221]